MISGEKNSSENTEKQNYEENSDMSEYEAPFILEMDLNKIKQQIIRILSSENIRLPGNVGLGVERIFAEEKRVQNDWRRILCEFVQEEIRDYLFSPPDRRYDGSDFFLPDFNEAESNVSNVLFMIDTSGSMPDDAITAAYYEVKGAIEQFDGKLNGWLGFFDAQVTPPIAFSDVDDLEKIRPYGGGGTRFDIIFDYINLYMKKPSCVVIMTDGGASYPEESAANEIPVLWLLVNQDSQPHWGRVARIKV